MPRARTRSPRTTYDYPDDYPQSLERMREAADMTWDELAREIGTSTLNLWRWRTRRARPNDRHLLALQDFARRTGLEHLLPTASVRQHTASD